MKRDMDAIRKIVLAAKDAEKQINGLEANFGERAFIYVIRITIMALLTTLSDTTLAADKPAIVVTSPIEQQQLAQKYVEDILKDPFSAQFRRQKGVCGEVNSKNSYGAYSGWRRYIAAAPGLVILEKNSSDPYYHTKFNDAWDSTCNGITFDLPQMDAQTAAAHAVIKSHLKYPSDTQWRNLKGSCGELNIMESNGIRSGWRRYIVHNKNAYAIEGIAISPSDFEKAWRSFCIDSPAPSNASSTTHLPQPDPTVVPMPAPVASPAPKRETGFYGYHAGIVPEARSCASAPVPVLMAKGGDAETYSITCDNGDVLTVRCEPGRCRALK